MPDNYDILEPTSAPSGTTTRTVRAIDVGSGELAGAAVLVDTTGVALIGQLARTASLPVTLSNSDIIEIAPYRVSTFTTANPTGVHVPTLPSGVTNDVLINGTTQPVSGNLQMTSSAVLFVIPVAAAGYNALSIGIIPAATTTGTCNFTFWPSTSTGTNVGASVTFGMTTTAYNLFMYPAQGAALATTISPLTANTNVAMPWNPSVPYVTMSVGGSGFTGSPAFTLVVSRIK